MGGYAMIDHLEPVLCLITFAIKSTGATPGVTRRRLKQTLKQAWRAAGGFWHGTLRKKHFTRAGAKEYGYSPRQGERGYVGKRVKFARSYIGRKLKTQGHTRPLEYSGASRTLTRIRDIRSTSKGGRVVIHARTFNRPRKGAALSMREEMTAVSAGERKTIAAVMNRVIQKLLDRDRTVTTKRL